eukprot:12898397-Prorocentrum_lima.AAC.1
MADTNMSPSKAAGHILPDYGHGSLHLGLPPELRLLFAIALDKLGRPIPHSPRSTNAKGKDSGIGHAQHVKATGCKPIQHIPGVPQIA